MLLKNALLNVLWCDALGDALRPLILHAFGGLYLDLDVVGTSTFKIVSCTTVIWLCTHIHRLLIPYRQYRQQ